MIRAVAPHTSATVAPMGDLVAVTLATAPDDVSAALTIALTIAQCSLLRADLLAAMQEAEAHANG